MRDKEHVLLGVFVGFVFESFAFGDEFVVAFFECGRNVTKEDEPGENFAVVPQGCVPRARWRRSRFAVQSRE